LFYNILRRRHITCLLLTLYSLVQETAEVWAPDQHFRKTSKPNITSPQPVVLIPVLQMVFCRLWLLVFVIFRISTKANLDFSKVCPYPQSSLISQEENRFLKNRSLVMISNIWNPAQMICTMELMAVKLAALRRLPGLRGPTSSLSLAAYARRFAQCILYLHCNPSEVHLRHKFLHF
jgi:hypothetical protein